MLLTKGRKAVRHLEEARLGGERGEAAEFRRRETGVSMMVQLQSELPVNLSLQPAQAERKSVCAFTVRGSCCVPLEQPGLVFLFKTHTHPHTHTRT